MTEVALKRIAVIVAGQSPPSEQVADYEGVGLPFLQGNAEFGAAHPRPAHRCDSAPKQARAGDILLSVRAPVGALNVADQTYGIGRGLAAVRPTGSEPRFVWWSLAARIEELQAMATGSTFDAVSAEDIGSLTIQLPALSEQREIANFLDAETKRIDALIEKKRRMIALANESFRATLDSAFALQAPSARLGRFVTFLTQGTSPEAENRQADTDEWGVLKLSAVRLGRYRPSENKALPASYAADAALVPRAGDVLVTRSNTPEYVGDVCAVSAEVPYRMLCDLIYLIRLDPRLDPRYAAYALLTSYGRRQLESTARGSSQSMVKLRGEDVKAVEIPHIPLGHQRRIIEDIGNRRSRLDQLVDAIERQIDLLREHRQALITAAVTGELDVAKAAA